MFWKLFRIIRIFFVPKSTNFCYNQPGPTILQCRHCLDPPSHTYGKKWENVRFGDKCYVNILKVLPFSRTHFAFSKSKIIFSWTPFVSTKSVSRLAWVIFLQESQENPAGPLNVQEPLSQNEFSNHLCVLKLWIEYEQETGTNHLAVYLRINMKVL